MVPLEDVFALPADAVMAAREQSPSVHICECASRRVVVRLWTSRR